MRLLLIVLSPPRSRGLHTAVNLAYAALGRGHESIIFCTGDGVENVRENKIGLLSLPLARLIEKGLKVMVCRESARRRGLLTGVDLINGVKRSSLAEMVELMDSCERTLVFG